jgi:hypothetical protein
MDYERPGWPLMGTHANNLEYTMKKIINGKIYNTDTATRIGNFASDCGPGDFRYEDTDLYITKKGAFFIRGEGGALSRWSEPCGNGQCGGSGIEAMTTAEALEWCEFSRIDADVIAQYFSVEEA